MTREELRDYVDKQRALNNIPYHVYSELIDGIDTLEQEPRKDAVSRAEVKKIAKEMYLEVANMKLDAKTISDCISCTSSKCREVLERKLQAINSVTPQEPRKEHWIIDGHHRRCPECDEYFCIKDAEGNEIPSSFCPNCGTDMREGKE